ncbi:MAG: DUF373 family protein [Candidatus Micrarchaeota archaeon]
MQRPIVLLCVDRDNDVYEKGGVPGPIIGREKNLDAAIKLALADPEDPDSNAMFYAIKLYDQFKKEGKSIEIVTISGHKNLGYQADVELSNQLNKISRELRPVSAILISDGIGEEEVIPIIKSRIRIDSTKIIFIKQAKELEKTYFVLIEKLKDPHYAKTIIGIPALLILLASLSSFFGLGWQPIGILTGLVLMLRIFGIDDSIYRVLKDFRFSVEKSSLISYIGGFALIAIGILITYQNFLNAIENGFGGEKTAAYVLSNSIVIFFLAAILIITGKVIDALHEKKKFLVTKYATYAVAITLAVLVLKVGGNWISNVSPPYVNFGDFLLTLVSAIFIGYAAIRTIKDMRAEILLKMKLDGKEVLNTHGTYLGKVIGMSNNDSTIVIESVFDKKYSVPLGSIQSIGNNVVIRE